MLSSIKVLIEVKDVFKSKSSNICAKSLNSDVVPIKSPRITFVDSITSYTSFVNSDLKISKSSSVRILVTVPDNLSN